MPSRPSYPTGDYHLKDVDMHHHPAAGAAVLACSWGLLLAVAGCSSAPAGPPPQSVRCEAGDMEDCAALGTFYMQERRDGTAARQYLERACAQKSAEGCFRLGELYEQGVGMEPDLRRAARMYLEACKLEYGPACEVLGSQHYDGHGTPQNQQQSVQFYVYGCRLGDALSCNEAGYQYDQGEGVAQDRQQALDYYRRACTRGLQLGCDNYDKLSAPPI